MITLLFHFLSPKPQEKQHITLYKLLKNAVNNNNLLDVLIAYQIQTIAIIISIEELLLVTHLILQPL